MRRFAFVILLALVALVPPSAEAEPFIPKMNEPESFKDYLFGLSEMRENIESVSCGGWVDNDGVTVNETSVTGNIPLPEVKDAPGRNNLANGLAKPQTGLSDRSSFEYPESAVGYSSACDIFTKTTQDPDLGKKLKNLRINQDGTVRSEDGDGQIDINPYGWCTRMDNATPTLCKRLFDAWQKLSKLVDEESLRPPVEDLCPCPTPNTTCPVRPEKRFCFDGPSVGPYTFECSGTSAKKDPVTTTSTGSPDTPPQEKTCRTTWLPAFDNKMTECQADPVYEEDGVTIKEYNIVTNVPGRHTALSSSFYRHYAVAIGQAGLEVKSDPDFPPQKTWKMRAECYEYYKEKNSDGSDFDPKTTVTDIKDEQCEIIMTEPEEREPKPPEWDESKQREKTEDDPPIDEPDRDPRTVPDPWVADTETNLSLLDMKKLKELQEGFTDPSDITTVLSTILPARQRASKAVPANARADATDDSDSRDFTKFWEAQQRELLKMTADPQTRLIMPARFLVGLSEDDPLFQYVKQTVSKSDGIVEITLRAGPEDMANVLLSLQRIFVAPIQEVRIPVLVPLAPMSQLNALIFQWEQWKREEDSIASRESRASKAAQADPIIAKLKEYRDRAEAVRKMRGALADYLVRLYVPQEEIRQYFAGWFQNLSAQLLAAVQRAEQRRELKRIWRLTQRSLLETDACQILWCSNQRYSVPVYSLLDKWWGTVAAGQPRNADVQPPDDLRNLNYIGAMDAVYDFSDMKFPREPLLVPTLWVVQVSVKLPPPPLLGADPPPASDFPALPTLPDENAFAEFDIPTVDLPPNPPQITIPITPNLEPAKDALRNIRKMIDGTDIAAQIIEEDELKEGEPIDEGGYPIDNTKLIDRDSLRGSYCRFPQSILIPPDSKDLIYFSDPDDVDHSDTADEKGNPAKIIHVENDLRERIQRLASRWMPQRTEDYAGRVARRNDQFTGNTKPKCTEDVICALLPPESTTITTWQWFMPTTSTDEFNDLAEELRDDLLPDDEDENPYRDVTIETLGRIFPTLKLPVTVILSPTPPPPAP